MKKQPYSYMNTRHHLIIILITLVLTSCHNGGHRAGDYPFLEAIGIGVTDELLLTDSLTLPDVYRNDQCQNSADFTGLSLTREQYESLIVSAGKQFADAMSNWLIVGVRDLGQGNTLVAYYACSGAGYSLDLITYDRQGRPLDGLNAREQHMLWRTHLGDADNDTVFTLDGTITFNGNHMTLHRTMGLCVMDWEKARKGAPLWQQQWDQQYSINSDGLFVLQGQRVVKEQGKVDEYAAMDFKSWDMLVCSLHDPGVMDTWNDYAQVVNSTYAPDYEYNPFPWDVAQLYKKNPQRFLSWMASHRGADNRLLPQFKLLPDDRPSLLQEIKRLDDAEAKQWLTSVVNSWDNQPLTKHL